jgi:hypothetical protein
MKRILAILALITSATIIAQKPQEEQTCNNTQCAQMCQSWGYCSGTCKNCGPVPVDRHVRPADCGPGGSVCTCTPFDCPECYCSGGGTNRSK